MSTQDPQKKDSVLITGGAGFIGSHIVDQLVTSAYEVTVVDNLTEQVHKCEPEYLNPDAEYVWGDIRDRGLMIEQLRAADIVIHQASVVGVGQSMYQIEKYVDVNTLGTAKILDIIVNEDISLKKFVVASSMSNYGEGSYTCPDCNTDRYPSSRNEEQLTEEDWEHSCVDCGAKLKPRPTPESKPLNSSSVYAITKRDQEELVLSVCKTYDIPAIALRYFNTYGSRQALENPYTGVCAIFTSRIKNDNPPLVFEDGRQTRDFVHVNDIARANEAAIESDVENVVLNVGTGNPTNIREVAETLIDLYGKDNLRPEIADDYRAGDIRHCYADISRTVKKLDWKPVVGFEEGMRELIRWSEQRDPDDNFKQAQQELEKKGLVGKE
jgi:dTDP-L-rhamnose 4-epimerase